MDLWHGSHRIVERVRKKELRYESKKMDDSHFCSIAKFYTDRNPIWKISEIHFAAEFHNTEI
jgi:hypothetical protein